MTHKYIFPDDKDLLKSRVLKSLDPITMISEKISAGKVFLFHAKRTNAGQALLEYYLCYFILVGLLGFKNIGQFEK